MARRRKIRGLRAAAVFAGREVDASIGFFRFGRVSNRPHSEIVGPIAPAGPASLRS